MHYLNSSIITALLFGFFLAVRLIVRLIDYTNNVSGLFVTISSHFLSNKILQAMAIKMYKIVDGTAPKIIKEVFKLVTA